MKIYTFQLRNIVIIFKKMNFEKNFSKNTNIDEPEENLKTSLNDSSIMNEIIDEDDLLNHLTPNDVIDKIQMYDSTV